MAQNRLHVRYLFKALDKVPLTERTRLREKISEMPILWAYRDVQRKAYDFVAPCKAYLPQAYTDDTDLETYFSVCDDIWFVDDEYLDSDCNREAWLQFLKQIGCTDHPRFIKEESFDDIVDELEWRNIKRQYSTREETIEEYYFQGL